MSPLALGALAAYLTAAVASRLPGQRERHGLAAAWWWLGMVALALHVVLHYLRWQALGGVDHLILNPLDWDPAHLETLAHDVLPLVTA